MIAWSEGHVDLADTLFLIAAVAFVLSAVGRALSGAGGHPTIPGWLLEVGLALVAVGLLVL